MPTQLNGRCCNMDDLGLIADKFGLQIFEDSAQALGARFKGKAAGTLVPSALSVSIRLRCWLLVMAAQLCHLIPKL